VLDSESSSPTSNTLNCGVICCDLHSGYVQYVPANYWPSPYAVRQVENWCN